MKSKQILTSKEIIRELSRQSGSVSFWDTFSRYIFILNNYLKGYPLSRIEANHKLNNRPRKYYLDLLIKGFNLDVDLNSPLFEDCIDTEHNQYGCLDDTLFYKRFFERLELLKKLGYEISPTILTDCIKMGDVPFKFDYFLLDKKQSNEIKSKFNDIIEKLKSSEGMLLSYLGITELTYTRWCLSSKDPKVGNLNLLYDIVNSLHKINSNQQMLINFLINERIVFDQTDAEDGSISIIGFIMVNYIEILSDESKKNEIINRYNQSILEFNNEK